MVSNQQGIGKGLMTDDDVQIIHDKMIEEIQTWNGRIDKTYHCPFLDRDNSILRKPNVGMALNARKDFSEIRFKKSVMTGDSVSDMVFGKRLKMKTVFIGGNNKLIRQGYKVIDFVYHDLLTFAKELSSTGLPASG